jgi:DNA primase
MLEALYVAAALREPRLVARDSFRACDELSHTGLRVLLAHAISGHGAEDALFEAQDSVKRAIDQALRQLPEDSVPLEQAFLRFCRDLMLRRINERLTYIQKATAQTPEGAYDLSEETRRLLLERIELLALKKRVMDELRPAPTGTKAPMQPV